MNDWIQTYTGRKFYPLFPKPEDVRIEDIAHALSLKCRFGGMCRDFYSVAEHSIYVSNIVPPEFALHGLLHDAGEAYLPDLVRPIKHRFFVAPEIGIGRIKFESIEKEVLLAIYIGLDIDNALYPFNIDEVKHADMVMLATEARDLMGEPPEAWIPLPPPLPETIYPNDPKVVEKLFLERFNLLKNGSPFFPEDSANTQAPVSP